MSDSTNALFICIDCELSGKSSDPTQLNAQSMCPRCSSSSVVPVDTFVELNQRKSRAQVVADRPAEQFKHQRKAYAEQRRRDSEPLRAYLRKRYPVTTDSDYTTDIAINKALDTWDGWAWHVYYPWAYSPDLPVDNPSPDDFVIELLNANETHITLIMFQAGVTSVKSF